MVQPPTRATAARHGLLLVVILGSLTALAPLSIDLYLPALPALGDDLGASTSLVQLTLTACVVGLGVGQLVAGPLADRYGRRPPLLAGLAGFAVSSGVCALAPTVEILVGLRFVQGATGAAGLVIARAVVRDVYGPAATRIFAALLLVTGLAPVVAPIVGAQMLHFTTWRGTFVVLLGLGVALLVATWLGLGESLAPDRRRADGVRATLVTLRRLVADRSFMPYVACFALTFGAFFAYISASPFVLEDIHGVSPQVFSAIFAVNSAALIGAAQVAGHVSGRLVEPHRLLFGGVGLVAICAVALLAIVLAGGGLWPLLVCLLGIAVANGIVVPTATVLAMAGHGHVAGSASALLGLCQFGLAGILAPLVGVAGSDSAVPMAVVIAACGLGALAATRACAPVSRGA
jgi:DHA1 family bicyclomycin/chloramphenicol resistance-like MFS transporter